MENKILEKVCKQVYKKFPFTNGITPRVSPQSQGRYLFIFSSTAKAPDGQSISQSVRVVTTEDGKIMKSSMSR